MSGPFRVGLRVITLRLFIAARNTRKLFTFTRTGVTLQSVRFADPYYGFVLTSVAGPDDLFFHVRVHGFWISLYHLYGLVVLGPHWCSVGFFFLPLGVFRSNRDIYEKGCFGECFWGTVAGLRSQFIYVAN